ncbi:MULTISPECIES: EamA family transporter [unclassified Microbacterium]|uniref:EamA family transporter n=1 Tax=unclassified Microbacterium TaxID=2609290 RepID=UPI00386DB5A9
MTRSVVTPRPPAPAEHTQPPFRVRGLVLAVVSALTFSVSGPIAKPLFDTGWSLAAVLILRMSIAGLVLSPALVTTLRRHPGFVRRHWLSIVAFGLIPVAGCQLFYFSAMQRMPVAVALLIQYLAPVLLVGFVWLRTRVAPSRAVLAGSVVAIVGLVLVVDIAGARFDALGTAFALAAAICVCVYFVMSERTGPDLPPLALAAGGLLVGAAAIGVMSLIGFLPFEAPLVTGAGAIAIDGLLPLLVIGVCTAAGYSLGVIAVPMIGSRLASFVGLSEVLFALMFAWILLAEAPAPIQFAGGALILAGVVLVRLDGRAAPVVSGPAEPLPREVGPGIR